MRQPEGWVVLRGGLGQRRRGRGDGHCLALGELEVLCRGEHRVAAWGLWAVRFLGRCQLAVEDQLEGGRLATVPRGACRSRAADTRSSTAGRRRPGPSPRPGRQQQQQAATLPMVQGALAWGRQRRLPSGRTALRDAGLSAPRADRRAR